MPLELPRYGGRPRPRSGGPIGRGPAFCCQAGARGQEQDFALTPRRMLGPSPAICRRLRRVAAGDRVGRRAGQGALRRGRSSSGSSSACRCSPAARATLPERQRTLRATIEWSYDLLSADEQRLFARPRRLRGRLHARSRRGRVARPSFDTLQSLVDKSLAPRHRRRATGCSRPSGEYAAEQLEEGDDAAVWQRRHAEWCCELAEREGGMPPHRDLNEGLGSLPDEYDNVRAAIAATWVSGLNELALRFGPACIRLWMSRGFFTEASSWLERAEPMIESAAPRVGLEALRAGV